jgi:hypothetical protein
MTLNQQVREALEALGNEPKIVASRLQEAGFHGKRRNSEECPIANFVNKRFELLGVEVGLDHIEYPFGKIELPPVITQFVKNFDNGCYPQLQEKE